MRHPVFALKIFLRTSIVLENRLIYTVKLKSDEFSLKNLMNIYNLDAILYFWTQEVEFLGLSKIK